MPVELRCGLAIGAFLFAVWLLADDLLWRLGYRICQPPAWRRLIVFILDLAMLGYLFLVIKDLK